MNKVFFKPENAWVGDIIPFYDNGEYKLYFLNDQRAGGEYGVRTTWDLVTTKDGLNFVENGTALINGKDDEQDRNAYTGSVIKDESGLYHIFYTGHNPSEKFSKDGMPLQAIMHATGSDGINFTKQPEHTFYSDNLLYEIHDWRDPFVFWSKEEDVYIMLVTARKAGSSERYGGCIAKLSSKDLKKWVINKPFFEPDMYITHECPDLFKMGDWYYLVYSTFSDKFMTHYRKSKELNGIYISPIQDTFDSRGFYAGKTASDGNKRYIFGWVPSKVNNCDFGDWEWAGTMVVHEIHQKCNGDLFVKMPEAIYNAFKSKALIKLKTLSRACVRGDVISLLATDTKAYVIFDGISSQCICEAEFAFKKQTRSFGLAIRTDEQLNNGYFIRFEPLNNRIVFDMWPRRIPGEFQWQIAGDKSHIVELERHLDMISIDKISVKLIIEEDIICLYVNDEVAMTTRAYNHKNGYLGFFVTEGDIKINNLIVKTM